MKASRKKRGAADAKPMSSREWSSRFIRGVLLWLIPVCLVWLLITPVYNLFLIHATENLVRLGESPSVTRLEMREVHYFVVQRTDVPESRGHFGSVRVTDAHFPLLLLAALFLAVPNATWRRKGEALGWALLISIFFHIVLLTFWVQFHYATQQGAWSAENYSSLEQNFWGLGKHLLDLPFKLALPLALWAVFFLRSMPRPSRRA